MNAIGNLYTCCFGCCCRNFKKSVLTMVAIIRVIRVGTMRPGCTLCQRPTLSSFLVLWGSPGRCNKTWHFPSYTPQGRATAAVSFPDMKTTGPEEGMHLPSCIPSPLTPSLQPFPRPPLPPPTAVPATLPLPPATTFRKWSPHTKILSPDNEMHGKPQGES